MLRGIGDLCQTMGALNSFVHGLLNFHDVIILPYSDIYFHLGELWNLSLAAHTVDQSLSVVSIFKLLWLVYAALKRDHFF
jgi:hypothetical protein